ncbi:MAG: Gfo/Idh/MocA family oxidoreductase, partial [Acidobacteria bacterium]|nr:Gfo/Idh/MocA family oxidoreductase [Acidobacteriota bacterium]
MQSSFSRRVLVTGAASSSLNRVLGANDRISVGIIGAGGRGTYNMTAVAQSDLNAEITAVCDIWRPNREKAAAWAAKTFQKQPRQTTDYRELLSWKDIDAVIIATPDFGHSTLLKAAVEAGKDVYCEKPFGIEFAKAKAAYLAVQKSDRVVQIGTQRRSDGGHIAAARLMHQGALGKVTRVTMEVSFQHPRWDRPYADVRESDVAWDQFLLDLPKRPFDARLLRQWQLLRPTSNGIAGLWMCHLVDVVHWFLEDPYPAGAVANGGVFLWKDGRDTADVFHALLDYPKGFLFSFAMSLTNSAANRISWYGTRGAMEGTIDGRTYTISGAGSSMRDKLGGEAVIAAEATNSHMQNFLECVRSRKSPRADYQAG